jgi:hypothetical protein
MDSDHLSDFPHRDMGVMALACSAHRHWVTACAAVTRLPSPHTLLSDLAEPIRRFAGRRCPWLLWQGLQPLDHRRERERRSMQVPWATQPWLLPRLCGRTAPPWRPRCRASRQMPRLSSERRTTARDWHTRRGFRTGRRSSRWLVMRGRTPSADGISP